MALNVTGVTFKDVASTLFQYVNRYIILYYILFSDEEAYP